MSHRFVALGVIHLALVVLYVAAGSANSQTATTAVVPYYGATYGTPGGFSAADAKKVVELLERIEQNTAAGGKAAAKPKGAELAIAARQHCASCHKPGSADGKGGGFVLFAGDDPESPLRPLGTRERQRVKEAVLAGDMPPNKKLAPDQKAAFE